MYRFPAQRSSAIVLGLAALLLASPSSRKLYWAPTATIDGCEISPSELEWEDTAWTRIHGPGHEARTAICSLSLACQGPDALDSLRSNRPFAKGRFFLKIDAQGKIAETEREDTGSTLKIRWPELFAALPGSMAFPVAQANKFLWGAFNFDSLGHLSRLTPMGFVDSLGKTDTLPAFQHSDSTTRSPESILKIIRANIGDFQRIYERHLKVNPNLGGKISLKFTIAPNGRIIKTSRLSSNSGCDQMDLDILLAVQQMRFDEIRRGNVTVTYAIVLDKDSSRVPNAPLVDSARMFAIDDSLRILQAQTHTACREGARCEGALFHLADFAFRRDAIRNTFLGTRFQIEHDAWKQNGCNGPQPLMPTLDYSASLAAHKRYLSWDIQGPHREFIHYRTFVLLGLQGTQDSLSKYAKQFLEEYPLSQYRSAIELRMMTYWAHKGNCSRTAAYGKLLEEEEKVPPTELRNAQKTLANCHEAHPLP